MKKRVLTVFLAGLISAGLLLTGCSSSDSVDNSDFVSDNVSEVTYETSDKNISWGAYQKNADQLGANAIELPAGHILNPKTNEDFRNKVAKFKERLDVLKSPYAVGYHGEGGKMVTVTMDDSKLGVPVFALMNTYYSDDIKIVSGLSDFEITNIKKMDYVLNSELNHEITVYVPEGEQAKLAQYLKEHIGERLYFKIDSLTFSSIVITESFTADKIIFEGYDFFDSNIDESNYSFIAELAKYVIENPSDGLFRMAFPSEPKDGDNYKVPFRTQVDDNITARVNALYSDTKVERDGAGTYIRFYFDVDPNEVSDDDCIGRIEKLFGEFNFDSGVYSKVSFVWNTFNNSTHNITFEKHNGSMVCLYYSDEIEEKIENNGFLKNYLKD